MGCCTAPLEGTPATNPSFQEVRVGDAGKAISFLEGCCRSRRKCWARGRGCLGAVGVPRMCPFPTVPEIRGVMISQLQGVGFTVFQVLSPIYTAFDLGTAMSLVGGHHYLQTIEGTGRSLGS